jgi:hypothetical protein
MVLNLLDGIIFLWLIVVSFILFQVAGHYKKITKNAKGDDLRSILEDIVKKQENLISESEENKKRIHFLETESKTHIQKISIIRFNPFKDTGGNQSFAVAFLNTNGDGMILSNLYARTGSRWYVKTIKAGKSTEVELSKEEEEAIKTALKN